MCFFQYITSYAADVYILSAATAMFNELIHYLKCLNWPQSAFLNQIRFTLTSRGLPVHNKHGLVQTSVLGSRFGTFRYRGNKEQKTLNWCFISFYSTLVNWTDYDCVFNTKKNRFYKSKMR